jgi:hypothetical protein
MSLATTIRAARRGLAAGAIGTATMTGWQELSAKLQRTGSDSTPAAEPEPPRDPWEQASVPAQVGRKLLAKGFG